MTGHCVFFLSRFFKTLDTVLKNSAMSSTLLCLCCHATCRATLLQNPVTTTSRAGAFFHVWDDKMLTILGPHGRLGRCCVQLHFGTVSGKTSDTVSRANL